MNGLLRRVQDGRCLGRLALLGGAALLGLSAMGTNLGAAQGDENWQTGFDVNGLNGPAYAVAVSASGAVYVGGQFTLAGPVPAGNIARWDGSTWSALGSGVNAAVRAIAVSGSDVYVGGDFTTAGGAAANYIAKWNGAAWSALGTGTTGTVRAIAISGADVYVGGNFQRAGGVKVDNITRWNGTTWFDLGGADAEVLAVAWSGGNLYVGGRFGRVNKVKIDRIARWNGSAWSALGSGMDADVFALAAGGGYVYAGGDFTAAGGAAAAHVARWNGASWSAVGAGADGAVYALAGLGTQLFVGGSFTTAGGLGASNVARWDGTNWAPLGAGLNAGCQALSAIEAAGAANLYAGGLFTAAGDKPSNYLAQWRNRAPVAVDDTYGVPVNSGPTPLSVLTNDSDPDGNLVSVSSKTDPAHGVLVITGGGTGLSYTPNPGYTGLDPFTYTISDGQGKYDSATVYITVVGLPEFTTFPSASPNPQVANRVVQFTCGVSDPGGYYPVTVTWDFGDGESATGETVTHTYRVGKIFTVTATATNSAGVSTTAALAPDMDVRWTFGQFNDDVHPDIVWWNQDNGNVHIWEMQGTSVLADTYAGDEDQTTWSIVGTGDFDRDGKADLVLVHPPSNGVYVRLMNGTAYGTLVRLGGASLTFWEVSGVGDLNGDGAADVFFRRRTDGVIFAWLTMGGTVPRVLYLVRLGWASYSRWHALAGTGDLNRDGKTDIAWREKIEGLRAYVWLMDGFSVIQQMRIGSANSSWTDAGMADMDGDGNSDLLWRAPSGGHNSVWRMDGTNVVEVLDLPRKIGANWRMVGPK